MPNSSATGGYLVPASTPSPLQGQSLEDFLQEVLVGISALDPKLVRPAFQSEPPNIPADSAWLAFRITNQSPDTFAVEQHDPTGDGSTTLIRHEIVTLLLSFYGSAGRDLASAVSDGFQISQNREVLMQNGMALVETGDLVPVPSLVKEKWLYRTDMTLRIRRQILRSYPVLNLLSAQFDLVSEKTEDHVDVSQPTP